MIHSLQHTTPRFGAHFTYITQHKDAAGDDFGMRLTRLIQETGRPAEQVAYIGDKVLIMTHPADTFDAQYAALGTAPGVLKMLMQRDGDPQKLSSDNVERFANEILNKLA